MVLPSPAAPDAVSSRRWLDRLSAVFHLARERGVLVLVRGGPERFGDVVRRVVELAPDAEVLVRADAMASLEPGSTVVVYLRRQDFDWLNMARPVVRGHRVVLFGDPETALALEQEAFDFFDWISHRIEAPAGPPAFAVRALRSATCARANVVVWKGGDLDATFAEALPGRRLVRVSAAQPYADLVEAMRPKPRTWVAVTDLGEGFRVQRARWAAAESGRYGRTILVEPVTDPAGAPVAHAKPANVEQAAEMLAGAGLLRGARLAGLLDLDPEAIARAVVSANKGSADGEIDTGASEFMRAPMLRQDLAARRLPDWPARVDWALDLEDPEVAKRWTTAWRSITNGAAGATATLARIFAFQGLTEEAVALLHEAKRALPTRGQDEERLRIWQAEASIHLRLNDHKAALRSLSSALTLAMAMGKGIRVIEDIVFNRVLALINLGRVKDAAETVSRWASDPLRGTAPFPDDLSGIRLVAALSIAEGKVDEAAQWLEKALEQLPREEDRKRDAVMASLALSRLGQQRYADAEILYKELIERAKSRGNDMVSFREGRADALVALGRYPEAEAELRDALEKADEERALPIRVHLAGSLFAQGRIDEAEKQLDSVLAIGEKKPHPADLSLALAMKAHVEEARGNALRGIDLRQRSIKAQEAAGLGIDRLVSSRLELARALLSVRRYSEAERVLKRTLTEAQQARDPSFAILALTSLAEAQAAQGFRHARDTARRALEGWIQLKKEPSPAVRATLESIMAKGPTE